MKQSIFRAFKIFLKHFSNQINDFTLIKVPYNLTDDEKTENPKIDLLDPIIFHKKPWWVGDAKKSIPHDGNLLDVFEYINGRPGLHKGAPKKYMKRKSKDILLQLERRRRKFKNNNRSGKNLLM